MNRTIYYLFLFLICSCGNSKKDSSSISFAGEIINPTSDVVILHKGDSVLGSARLDENNRFSFKLDSLEDGLYHFYHRPEYQVVYLEKGDSLQIRFNTYDFDESLVFSGNGEEINNLLLELYLIHENEKSVLYSFYPLEPEAFIKKVDSLKESELQLLADLKVENPTLSKKALKMAQASVDYNSYILKEKYPFYHKKRKGEKTIHELPNNFYDYRKNINYKDKDLVYLGPYYEFMKDHFGNLSYMNCSHLCKGSDKDLRNQLHFNTHKMKLIDSLVQEKSLKDNLFRNVAVDYLLMAHDSQKNNKIFIDEFYKYASENKYQDEITTLYEGVKNIQPNHKIPDVMVVDTAGSKISLSEIAEGKNVVFYFWTGTRKRHYEDMTKHVKKLSEKYKEYTFVGLNFNTEPKRWKSLLQINKLDPALQFRTDNYDELDDALVIYPLNKGIITKDGIIVNGFANMYTSFIE